jgi:hypothetical protein
VNQVALNQDFTSGEGKLLREVFREEAQEARSPLHAHHDGTIEIGTGKDCLPHICVAQIGYLQVSEAGIRHPQVSGA